LDHLQYELAQFIRFALSIAANASTVIVRFYGGWLENSVLTQRASFTALCLKIYMPSHRLAPAA
jgi:hypothetical protein